LFLDAVVDFFFWPGAAEEDAAATVGGGLSGFFARFPSFDDVLSTLRLIVYGSSNELADIIDILYVHVCIYTHILCI